MAHKITSLPHSLKVLQSSDKQVCKWMVLIIGYYKEQGTGSLANKHSHQRICCHYFLEVFTNPPVVSQSLKHEQ